MKIINVNKALTSQEILDHLTRNVNKLFHEQRQTDMSFAIEQKGDGVELSQPEVYEGFLFRIEPHVTELWITRSEHYTDDVNSLALESILYQLIEDISGNKGDKMVIEG